MKRVPGLFLLFLYFFSPCKAQYNSFGGEIGLAESHLLNFENGEIVPIEGNAVKFGIGSELHVNGEFNFSAHFSFIPSFGLEYWTGNNSNKDGTYRLVFPELMRFYPASMDISNPKVRWYTEAGPYYGLAIGAFFTVPQSNIGFVSRNIFGLKLGTGLSFPLWNGFASVGADLQSDILFATSSIVYYPTGGSYKSKGPVYTLLLSLGYHYPFDFRHFKFLSLISHPGSR